MLSDITFLTHYELLLYFISALYKDPTGKFSKSNLGIIKLYFSHNCVCILS